MTGSAPFFVNHTIRLTRTEVLEALRGAALNRARETLRLVEPTPRGVEMETRLLSGAMVEIDGAAVMIEGRLPEDLAALLRAAPLPAPAAARGRGETRGDSPADPSAEPLVMA
ncbi:methionyl-tRNA synthetase [Roseomonas sp. GC11]|uniref:methionyl-tRNA synthetase n=1 Tax=Roseomonas sp. GC11 TaxID=2950546 RepID=UPI00210BAAFC|nr:methionyl-tRNA synthetase [Roseomonas sp. GC11]MCQ4159932.1 methionyl-tRNA synthetase [Roseomonas sp. GC11]